MEYTKDNHIQARINEAKYYLSFGKTDDALEQLLPVLVYLQIPHSIVEKTYVISAMTKMISLNDFNRLKSFIEHMNTESKYHFLNEYGCLEAVQASYVDDLIKIIEERCIIHSH